MVASAKVYSSNTAQTEKDVKFIQMGFGGAAEGYWDKNGNYIKPQSTPDFYVGASTNGDGTGDPSIKVEYGPAGYDSEKGIYLNPNSEIFQPTPQTNNTTTKATGGYSRTTAKTANDIAQGGMTKQEVQEFNMKHPNETALRRA